MKTFADKFGEDLAATLPPISQQHINADPRLLGSDKCQVVTALAHQRAVRNDMKKEQEDLRSNVDKPDTEQELEAKMKQILNDYSQIINVTPEKSESEDSPSRIDYSSESSSSSD